MTWPITKSCTLAGQSETNMWRGWTTQFSPSLWELKCGGTFMQLSLTFSLLSWSCSMTLIFRRVSSSFLSSCKRLSMMEEWLYSIPAHQSTTSTRLHHYCEKITLIWWGNMRNHNICSIWNEQRIWAWWTLRRNCSVVWHNQSTEAMPSMKHCLKTEFIQCLANQLFKHTLFTI